MIRLLLAAALAFVLSTLLTRLTIDVLTRSRIGQPIREDGPEGHMIKAGTLERWHAAFFPAGC